jgi:predicted DNA-binding transcriptional regulator AlpA
MDQTTPKTGASDSATMLATMTAGQLEELLTKAIQGVINAQQVADRFLDAKQAAEMLSMSEDWLYRNAKKLPFTRKLGPKVLRFSYQGLVKWMATRKLS